MPYAVHLFFDPVTDQAIQTIWQELVDSGIAPYLGVSGNRPQISLALCEELDQGGCHKRLEAWAAKVRPLPISFQNLGIFPAPGAVVFAGPVVTQQLLALQHQVDGLLEGCCTWPAFNYYRPGHWIPHCTLAMEFDDDKLPQALDIASHLKLPLNGLISGVGVIEFRPVKHLFAFPLSK